MKNKLLIIAVAVGVLTYGNISFAEDEKEMPPIKFQATSQVEVIKVNKKGKEEVKLVDADKAKVIPGNVIVFTNNYTNMTDNPISNIEIVNPVPEHVIYIGKSAVGQGTDIDFSVDGGSNFDKPKKLFVKNKKGKKVRASESDYTHIRWKVRRSIDPGKGGFVSFKAKIK